MKTIRRGNDIHVKWAVTVNDGDINLTDCNLTVELKDERGRVRQMPFSITDGRVIDFNFFGIDQTTTGRYSMLVWLDKGKHGQAVLDHTDAFCLVEKCREAGGFQHNSNVQIETIEFSSEMVVGIQGKSAYQSWLDDGNEGTEHDFVEYNHGKVSVLAAEVNDEGHLIIHRTDDLLRFEIKDKHLIMKV